MTSTPSQEKVTLENVEAADSDHHASAKGRAALSADDFGFSPAEQKKIMRHLDRRLVLTVGAMYCVSLMDRTNLGAANIAGMSKDLVLIGNRYVSLHYLLYLSFFCMGSEVLRALQVLWGVIV
jgi:hypothetical protein